MTEGGNPLLTLVDHQIRSSFVLILGNVDVSISKAPIELVASLRPATCEKLRNRMALSTGVSNAPARKKLTMICI